MRRGSRDGKRYVGDCSCATTRRIGAVTSSRQLENVKTLLAVTRSGRQRREDLDIMVIPWLLLLEMGLYASSFVCGIVTASSLTIVQVKNKVLTLACYVNFVDSCNVDRCLDWQSALDTTLCRSCTIFALIDFPNRRFFIGIT